MKVLTLVVLLLSVVALASAKGKPQIRPPPPRPKPQPGKAPVPAQIGDGAELDGQNINADISSDTKLIQNSIIPEKTTVVVSPGVTITLAPLVNLTIRGTLVMTGSEQKVITIKGGTAKGGSVYLEGDGNLVLKDAVVKQIGALEAAIIVNGPAAVLDAQNTHFENIAHSAVWGMKGSISSLHKCVFKDIGDIGLLLSGEEIAANPGDGLGEVKITDSYFEGCKSHAIKGQHIASKVSISGCTFTKNGDYAVKVTGEGGFQVKDNVFTENRGAFMCRWRNVKANIYPAGDRQMLLEGNSFGKNNAEDGQGTWNKDAAWSKGNLIYMHGCNALVLKNEITNNEPAIAVKESSLLNFYDGNIDFDNNTVTGNTQFKTILNVGGSCKLRMRRNIISNINTKKDNREIANYNSEQAVDGSENWWGCDTDVCIKSRIQDFADGEKMGAVEYTPFLTKPDMNQYVKVPNPWSDDEVDPWGEWNDDDDDVKYIVDKDDFWGTDKNVTESIWIKEGGCLSILVDQYAAEIVNIRMGPNTHIHVDGTLQIIGQPGIPVIFSPLNGVAWGSITFSKKAKGWAQDAEYLGSLIRNAKFENGGTQHKEGRPGAVIESKVSLFIEDTIFKDSRSNAVMFTDGQLMVSHCEFERSKLHAIAFNSKKALLVESSVFRGGQNFAMFVPHAPYNISNNLFEQNMGVVCARRHAPQGVQSDEKNSTFVENTVQKNQYPDAAKCWGDTGDDEFVLISTGYQKVIFANNSIIENTCDSAAVRRRARISVIAGNNVAVMEGNFITKNFGQIFLERKAPVTKTWDHEPPPFIMQTNLFENNLFFRIYLGIPNRQAKIEGNTIRSNEVTDSSSLKEIPLLEIVGGSWDRRPMIFKDTHLIGNEGSLLAIRLHSRTVATGCWFTNPFMNYEVAFVGEDVRDFSGPGNYWGDFRAGDANLVKARLQPRNGKVPKRWYARYLTASGVPVQEQPKEIPNGISAHDKNTAIVSFIVLVVLGFLLALGVAIFMYCNKSQAMQAFAALEQEMQETKPNMA